MKNFIINFLLVALCAFMATVFVYCYADKPKPQSLNDYQIKKQMYPAMDFTEYCMAKQSASVNGINEADYFQMIQEESGFRQNALSSAGAISYSQLMIRTAAGLGICPWDAYSNFTGGALHYKFCLKKANGNNFEAFCMYNAGHNYLKRHPAYPRSTQMYAARCTGMIAVAIR